MLGDQRAARGRDDGSRCRYVDRVVAVSPRADDIEQKAKTLSVDWRCELAHRRRQSGDFSSRLSLGAQKSEKRGDLSVGN